MNLRRKLQVKSAVGFTIADCPDRLTGLFESAGLDQQMPLSDYVTGGILLFIQDKAALQKGIVKFLNDPQADNHWIAFPKKNSGTHTDLTRDRGWEPVTEQGWLPVRQVSIDDHWTALRFRQKASIAALRRGTDYPGIDSKAKTVQIPDMLLDRLSSEGLVQDFETLSFTRRKEYVIGVISAKKLETREKRINKVITDLSG